MRRFIRTIVFTLAACAAAGALRPQAAAAQAPSSSPAAVLVERARAERRASPSRALPLAQQAAAAARAAGEADAEIQALVLAGDCQSDLGQLPASSATYETALALSRARGVSRQMAEVRFRLAKNLMGLNRYQDAVEGLLEALKLAEEAKDSEFAAVVTDHLGITHYTLRNREKAFELCRRASAVLEHSKDQGLYAQNLQHIGIIHTGAGQWAEALTYFNRALAIRDRLGEPAATIGTLGNVALALHRLGRSGEALAPLARALALAAGTEDPRIEPYLRLRRGQILAALGRPIDAERDYERALQLDRTLGNKRRLAATLGTIADFYQRLPGHEARSAAYYAEALGLSHDVYNENTTARINEFQARFDAERREREIQLLQRDKAIRDAESSREWYIRVAAAVVALLLAGGLTFAVIRYRAEARTARDLRDALQKVRLLQGLLPICSHCKKIRDDDGYWQQVESYVGRHSEAKFSHSICPECLRGHYPDVVSEAAADEPRPKT